MLQRMLNSRSGRLTPSVLQHLDTLLDPSQGFFFLPNLPVDLQQFSFEDSLLRLHWWTVSWWRLTPTGLTGAWRIRQARY